MDSGRASEKLESETERGGTRVKTNKKEMYKMMQVARQMTSGDEDIRTIHRELTKRGNISKWHEATRVGLRELVPTLYGAREGLF